MNDAQPVRVTQGLGQLPAPVQGLVDGDGAFVLAQTLAQAVAVHVLQHQVGLAALLGQVDAALHARVMEAPGDLRLPPEALEEAGVGEKHGVG